MSYAQTSALGALAGFTIFLGLPLGRMRVLGVRSRVALAMFAVGVLTFLLVDVLGHAFEIVEHDVETASEDGSGAGATIGLGALLAAAFALGSVGLAAIDERLRARRVKRPPMAGGAVDVLPAGAEEHVTLQISHARATALRAAMVTAAAIGLHNFAEGLAIGVASSSGELTLATVLIVGFALHNATEGFGIVGPLGAIRPSWRWLAVAGLVAGSPTLLGTLTGYSVDSQPLELAFYALSGGAILFVIGEVWHAMRRQGHHVLGLALLAAGFTAGVATDLIVVYGGG